MPPTSVAVLGSTGSIGTQTLEVVADRPDDFDVVALGAARSVDLLVEQACAFRPDVVAVADPSVAADVASGVPDGTEVLAGPDALAEAAVLADVTINGVVGFAGLPVTLATLAAGRRLGQRPRLGVNPVGDDVGRVGVAAQVVDGNHPPGGSSLQPEPVGLAGRHGA